MYINEDQPVLNYIHQSLTTIDGIAWLIACAASLLCALDIAFSANVLPIREIGNASKALVLIAFSPLIVLLVMIVLRQLPFANLKVSQWVRGALCIVTFLLLNF